MSSNTSLPIDALVALLDEPVVQNDIASDPRAQTGSALAVIGSLWGTIQIELLNRKRWVTRRKFSLAVVGRIEGFYDRRRRHSSLCKLSPVEDEKRHHKLTAA